MHQPCTDSDFAVLRPDAKCLKFRERVTGVEPATLCLASTRSSQLSYTRKSEEVLVASRVLRVNHSAAKVYWRQRSKAGCFGSVVFFVLRRRRGRRAALEDEPTCLDE